MSDDYFCVGRAGSFAELNALRVRVMQIGDKGYLSGVKVDKVRTMKRIGAHVGERLLSVGRDVHLI